MCESVSVGSEWIGVALGEGEGAESAKGGLFRQVWVLGQPKKQQSERRTQPSYGLTLMPRHTKAEAQAALPK